MQDLSVKSGAGEPETLDGLANAEDPLQSVEGDAFGEQGENQADDVRGAWRATHSPLASGTWPRAEAVKDGITPDREFAVASLTAQIGNVVVAVDPVPNQRVHARIGNQAVGAFGIEARVAFGVDRLLATARTLDFIPRWRRGIGRTQLGESDGVCSAVRTIVFGAGVSGLEIRGLGLA